MPELVDSASSLGLISEWGTAAGVSAGRTPWRRFHRERRYCRGDWSTPKSRASNATIAVDRHVIVIDLMHRLKSLTVEVKAVAGQLSEWEPAGRRGSVLEMRPLPPSC
jgi:hypothetical protein